jgi:hypothetical protein
MEHIEFFLKKQYDDVEIFAGDFTDGMTEGFKSGSSYSDVTHSLSELPTDYKRIYRQNVSVGDSIGKS